MDYAGEGVANSLPLGIFSKWGDAWMPVKTQVLSKLLNAKSEPTQNYIYDI